jgi:hypothetical protein
MTDDQIKHMVDRFLSWPLPENFNPDGGIKFTRLPGPMPTGTNLFMARQATPMVQYMVEDLPEAAEVARLKKAADAVIAAYGKMDGIGLTIAVHALRLARAEGGDK